MEFQVFAAYQQGGYTQNNESNKGGCRRPQYAQLRNQDNIQDDIQTC